MNKRIIALFIAVIMLFSAMPLGVASQVSHYADTDRHWAKVYINDFSSYGYITGYPNGTFLPDNLITRAEVSAILARMPLANKYDSRTFTDVAEPAWYSPFVNDAAKGGIIAGYPNGTFAPEQNLTREEAFKLVSYFYYKEDVSDIELDYTDSDKIGQWAEVYTKTLLNAGILSGYPDGGIHPKNNITRAELVKLLYLAISENTDVLQENVDSWHANDTQEPTEPTEPAEPTEPTKPPSGGGGGGGGSTSTATKDNADISNAFALINGMSKTDTQINIPNTAAAKAAIESIISGLELNGVTAVVVDGAFSPAIAGTASSTDGTNGSYTFTVTLNKGAGTQQTASGTLTITATAYDPTQDNLDITAAFNLIDDMDETVAQSVLNTQDAAKTHIEGLIALMSLDGVTAVVVDGAFSPAIAGTASSTDGTNGSYTFTVTLNKGAGTQQTASGTLTITATAYVSTVQYSVKTLTLEYGDTMIVPATATSGGAITYSSDSTDIATVNPLTGEITVKAVGTAVMTATADGGSDTLALTVVPAVVDVILFAGQSNMNGQGTAVASVAPKAGTAYEYRLSSNSVRPLADPVGEALGNLGPSNTRSLLPSFIKEYHDQTGRKTVAVHASQSGSSITQWISGQSNLTNAQSRFNGAITYLNGDPNFVVGRKLFVWLQGEAEVRTVSSADQYKANFINMRDSLITNTGMELFTIIRIGNYPENANHNPYHLDHIRNIAYAQNELAYEHDNIIMGTKSAYEMSLVPAYMKPDMYHFNTPGLEILGRESAHALAYFLNNDAEIYHHDIFLPQNITNQWNDNTTLNGDSFETITPLVLPADDIWAVEFSARLNNANSNGMLLTHVDNSDAYLWLDASDNTIKLKASGAAEIAFNVGAGDLTTLNKWRLEFLPTVAPERRQIALFKNGEFVTRAPYAEHQGFVFDGMYGGYKTADYQYNFDGIVEDVTIYNSANAVIKATGISLSNNVVSVSVDSSTTVTAAVIPVTATDGTVSYLSNNTDIATVTNAGVITGISVGTTTITVTSTDLNATTTITVHVTPKSDDELEMGRKIPLITEVGPIYSRLLNHQFNNTPQQAMLLDDLTPEIMRMIDKEYTMSFRVKSYGSSAGNWSSNMLFYATTDKSMAWNTSGNNSFQLGIPNLNSTGAKNVHSSGVHNGTLTGSYLHPSNDNASDETWHTITFRNTADNVFEYFIDGVKVLTSKVGPFDKSFDMADIFAAAGDKYGAYFGGFTHPNNGSYYNFVGYANYITIYNEALTDQQIERLILGGDNVDRSPTDINILSENQVVNNETIELTTGSSRTLIAQVLPFHADNKDVTWSVDGDSSIGVNNGIVTISGDAVNGDTAVITVVSDEIPSLSATVTINVIGLTGDALEMARAVPTVSGETAIYSAIVGTEFTQPTARHAVLLEGLTPEIMREFNKEFTFVFRVKSFGASTAGTSNMLLHATTDSTKGWDNSGNNTLNLGIPNINSTGAKNVHISSFIGTSRNPVAATSYIFPSDDNASDGTWHTIVFRNTAANVFEYFIDGVKIAENKVGPFEGARTMADLFAAPAITGNYGVYFGGFTQPASSIHYNFVGKANYVSMYNKVLTDAQISSLTNPLDGI